MIQRYDFEFSSLKSYNNREKNPRKNLVNFVTYVSKNITLTSTTQEFINPQVQGSSITLRISRLTASQIVHSQYPPQCHAPRKESHPQPDKPNL